jgi:hypothetical protein
MPRSLSLLPKQKSLLTRAKPGPAAGCHTDPQMGDFSLQRNDRAQLEGGSAMDCARRA